MRRVVFNQKGGVGKTTITCNLAAISAARGKRTLVVDLDPQSNSTQYLLGENAFTLEKHLAGYFQDLFYSFFKTLTPEDCIHETPYPGLYLLPAHPDLDELKSKLDEKFNPLELRKTIDSIKGFDAVYIDTPPALNVYSRFALAAADTCLIPFDCDIFSKRALFILMDKITEIKKQYNPDLRLEGIIVNHFQNNANLPRQIVSELREDGLPVLNSYLTTSVKIRESHNRAIPVVFMDSQHKLSMQFQSLYDELNP